MFITAEISYYPLTNEYSKAIDLFIEKLAIPGISIKSGTMSTLLTGEFHDVMDVIKKATEELMKIHPSVFNIKISNACPVREKQ